MKKLLICFAAVCLLVSFTQAQQSKYSRVKIYTGANGLKDLSAKGVAIDHGSSKRNTYFISDFSEKEIEIIKSSGYSYEIVISDVSLYYTSRNTERAKTESNEQSLECKYCPLYSTPANFKLGSMGGFYTYDEMLVILDSMASKYPNLITIKQPVSDSTTWEERSVLYVKISDNPAVDENEPEALFTSLHHAREPESLSQLIFFMWYLLENYGTNTEATYLVNNLELYFIPCVNPDGYIFNQLTNPSGGGLWRKNKRDNGDGTQGVDLNRNYGFHFGFDNTGSSPVTGDDSYRGPSAFSEPETQMIREFCKQHQFKVAINHHTFGDYLVMPWDYDYNLLTPDATTYDEMGKLLTYCNGFAYGTPNQTVGYIANGGSNDWMYGEQTEKNKIFTFTPEAGLPDDGFWPASSRIATISKVTMHANLYACKLAGIYGQVESKDEVPVSESQGYIHYTITRLGGQQGDLQVSVSALNNGVFDILGNPKVYSSLQQGQTVTDSIPYTLNSSLTVGQSVRYIIHVNNGAFDEMDTVIRLFGEPQTVFYDAFNSAAAWNIGTWGITTSNFSSAPSCITDSPDDIYHENQDKSITTLDYIDLTNVTAAWLNFDAMWDIEHEFDFAEVLVSTNGTAFTPLCGKNTKRGSANQDINKPVLDSRTRSWITETMDLSTYAGKKIKLRFRLKTDFGENRDGIYIDEVKVVAVSPFNVGIAAVNNTTCKLEQNVPNPFGSITTISYSLPDIKDASLEVFNQVGEKVLLKELKGDNGYVQLDMKPYPTGMYFYRIVSTEYQSATYKMVVTY